MKFKKSLLFLSILLATPFMFGGNMNNKVVSAIEIPSVEGFDDKNISLSFFSFSDTHIGYGNNDVLLHNAYKFVRDELDVDLLVCAGDIAQDGKKEQVENFRAIYDTYFDVDETPLAMCYGNHDTHWSGCMKVSEFYDALGEDFFKNDLEDETKAREGNRHLLVNGYHFLSVEMASYGPNNNKLSTSTSSWLKNQLDTITRENPNQYVFVITHSPALNTCIGSRETDDSGIWGASQELYDIYSKYPQVCSISGHTHYTNHSDLYLSSNGGFISVGAPSLTDFTFNYLNVPEMHAGDLGANIDNARSYSYGQFFEIDNKGNIRITRYDFKNNEIIGKPNFIPAPKEDKSHITALSDKTRKSKNQAPYYNGNQSIVAYYLSEEKIEIRYPSFKDDDVILYYVIAIKNSSGLLLDSYRTLGQWPYYPNPDKVPQTLTFVINKKLEGKYIISVTAYDEWDVASIPFETSIERNIVEDKLKASQIENRIYDLMDLDVVPITKLDEIRGIRSAYDSYDYLVQSYVSNYRSFVEIETRFYNTYFINDDVIKYSPRLEDMYSNSPVDKRGSFSKGNYGGIALNWESGILNNSIGYNQGYKLDSLHMCFTNFNFNIQNKKLGIILDNDIQIKYEKGVNYLLLFDFDNGSILEVNGDVETLLGKSDYLKYSSLSKTPWSIKFNETDNKIKLSIVTVNGNYECDIDKSHFTNLTNYTNFNNTFVTFTPYGDHSSFSFEFLSIHNGNCYEEPKIPLTSMIIEQGDQTLNVGDMVNLTVKYTPNNAIVKSLVYSSSDSNVASISSSGKLVALKSGRTIIEVTSDNGVSCSINVKVIASGLLPTCDNPIMEVNEGNDVSITYNVDSKGLNVDFVFLDGNQLTQGQYTYINNDLIIDGVLVKTLLAGEHKIIVDTLGGDLQLTLKVTKPSAGCAGCSGSIIASSVLICLFSTLGLVLLNKKRKLIIK